MAGKVLAAPNNSDKILVFDPVTKAVEGVDITDVATGNGKFDTAIMLIDGWMAAG